MMGSAARVRLEDGAGVFAVGLTVALILAVIGVAVWVTVYEDARVKVEVRLDGKVDTSKDPTTARVGVRISSKLDVDVHIISYHVRLYTDSTERYQVLDEAGGDLYVPARSHIENYYTVVLTNLGRVGSTLYVVFDMTHEADGEGGPVSDHYARTIDLDQAWKNL